MQTVNTETPPTTRAPRLSPRRLPPWLKWSLAVVAGVVVLLAVALLAFRLLRSGVLPGVEVADVDVGGLSRGQLEETVGDLADQRSSAPLTVTLDDRTVEGTAEAAGYRFDVEATVAAAWRHGRQSNPLRALGDHIRSFWQDTLVRPEVSVDDAALTSWTASATRDLRREPVEGSVSFAGATVEHSDPVDGAAVIPEQLRADIRAAVLEPGPDTLSAPHRVLEPVSTADDVAAMVDEAELAVSAPIVLVRNDGELRLEPEEIGDLLTVTSDFSGGEAAYGLAADTADVEALVPEDLAAAFAADPVSATFTLTGSGMRINESSDGFRFDTTATRDQILFAAGVEAGDDDLRRAVLDGEILEPERTTEEAEALEIVEPVASFTTNHACCQSRVTNIQRFADIVRGTVVEPGETISLNGVVGPRTRAKGFVGGGAILRGEYIEDVGGGVSQFATTFFNAAYFGGYEIVEHKPHSYYISRYPVGRESTINWPGVDVVVRNDSPYGMYVHTSYTSTSISVTLWGREWADVSSQTGSRFRIRQPQTEVRINRDLPPGTERVTQGGSQGFDIVVTRTIDYLEDGRETEEYYTRYLPEPRIVERNPAPDGG